MCRLLICRGSAPRISRRRHTYPDSSLIKISLGLYVRDIILRHFLHPYGLPDPALRRVEHAAPVQTLFASGMVRSIAQVFYRDGQFILSVTDQRSNVRRKRQVSSCMPRRLLPVHIYDARLVHCSKVQDQTPSCFFVSPFFKRKCAPVPEIFVRLQLPGYTGEHSLR